MKKIVKWFENYWDYYKWQVLIAAFFIVVITFLIVQTVQSENPDITFLYAGPSVISPEVKQEMEDSVELLMSEDFNGDGKKVSILNNMELLTDEQLEEASNEAAAQGNELYYNAGAMSEARKNFTVEVFAGDSVICMLDPYWYELIRENDGFAELEEILGYKPENAIDDYSIRLGDTDFAKYFSAFAGLPDDTVLCVRRMSTTVFFTGVKNGEKEYEYSVQMFKDLMGFKNPA